MDSCGLDMFHDAHDMHILSVTNRICFRFMCPAEEVVDQHPVVRQMLEYTQNMSLQFLISDHDSHSLSSQHIRRPDENRISDPVRSEEHTSELQSRGHLV